MNLPIARGLRGLLYVLSDLSQVDPSDLSALFAGYGRLRLGFAEIDPGPVEPSEAAVDGRSMTAGTTRTAASPAGRDVTHLHPGRLVERGRRENQIGLRRLR